MDGNDIAICREVIATTNSRGWELIVERILTQTVVDMERKAIDEEDDAKGAALRREAKAARTFLTNVLKTVEAYRHVELQPTTSDDGFITYTFT